MATLLAVERSLTQRKLLRHYAEAAGHEVLEADCARDALQLAAEHELDAVLLAWELEDAPAPVLLQTWGAQEHMRFVPVLMVTSHHSAAWVREALALGAVDFLRKPVEETELIARLAAALRARKFQLDLHRLATRDGLTDLANRRDFLARSEVERTRCRRYGGASSVALLDIDFFKSVNDRFGHDGGDSVLVAMARLLSEGVRNIDLVGRLGGEEFAVLMPETTVEGGLICLDRLLEACRRATWLDGRHQVTFSAGVASLETSETVDDALRLADLALYRAKGDGRARCYAAAQPANSEAAPSGA